MIKKIIAQLIKFFKHDLDGTGVRTRAALMTGSDADY